jgi:KaiC/GvpD/RAD55 family RecA-like ATPase
MNTNSEKLPVFTTFSTGITGLDCLLTPKSQDSERETRGIKYREEKGFFGVVLGAAGSGKSILALQLGCCCKFMDKNTVDTKVVYLSHEPPDAVRSRLAGFGSGNDQDPSAIHCFGTLSNVFIQTTKKKGEEDKSEQDNRWLSNAGLHIVQLPFDVAEQVDVLTNIVDRAREDQESTKNTEKKSQWLVLFDNAETIFSQAYEKAFDLERSAEATPLYGPKEGVFLKRLRDHFAKSGVSSIFFFEEPGSHEQGMTYEVSKTGLAYAADVVIHLSCQTVSEYRQRTLEIVKARNQAHRRGWHHFSIRGGNTGEPGIIIYPSIATQLHIIGKRDKIDSERSNETPGQTGQPCVLGIRGVDKGVHWQKADEQERIKLSKQDDFEPEGYLDSGTVGVLVSDLDSIASEIALHFSLQNKAPALYLTTLHQKAVLREMIWQYSDLSKECPERKDSEEKWENHHLQIRDLFPEHISEAKLLHDIEKWIDQTIKKGSSMFSVGDLVDLQSLAGKLKQPANPVSTYLESQLSAATRTALANYQGSNFDPGLLRTALVVDLNKIIGGQSIYEVERFAGVTLRPETRQLLAQNPQGDALVRLNRRLLEDANIIKQLATKVVVDNVFRFSKKFPLIHDEGQFLAALFALLRSKRVVSLVVDMVDVGEGSNPLHESLAAGLADHVFILRHAQLRSEVSKVFSVVKLAGRHEPETLWELQTSPQCIIAEDRLAFYKGTLSGRPEPVEVMLSLFAASEDSPVHKYLKTECEVLQATFDQRIKVHTCHPETYGALQHSVVARNLNAMGDCHVISIDEIWLGELIKLGLLQNFQIEYRDKGDGKNRETHDLWAREQYVTAGQDIAISRNLELMGKKDPKYNVLKKSNFAVPERLNVGILTYDPNVWGKEVGVQSKQLKQLTHEETEKSESKETVFDWIKKFELEWCCPESPSNKPEPDSKQDQSSKPVGPESPPGISPKWKELAELQKKFVQRLGECRPDNTPISPSLYRAWENEEDDICKKCKEHEKLKTSFPPVDWMPSAGVFTCCMESREACVSFFLELVLSVMQEESKDKFLVNKDGELDWGINAVDGGNAWGKALSLMLQLLSPWDLMRLSHAWYRQSRFERPCLFSRQWFAGWGMLGQTRPGLIPLELPTYDKDNREPACVSGTWYLGILSGGTAQRAGAQIIEQLTSPGQELFKFNRGIGMPVRKNLYEAKPLIGGRQKLLYAKRMVHIAELKKKDREQAIDEEVRTSRCPFFRETIRRYQHISPLLMGMMVEAAKTAVRSEWLWTRDEKTFKGIEKDLKEEILKAAQIRYEQILKQPE